MMCIITPFGSYVIYYIPFGLRNAGCTFQRLMNKIFGNLSFVVVYIEDNLISSRDPEEHHKHRQRVLQLMHTNDLIARRDNCVCGVKGIDFLVIT